LGRQFVVQARRFVPKGGQKHTANKTTKTVRKEKRPLKAMNDSYELTLKSIDRKRILCITN
jgi:hypothetical protein